VSNYDDALIPSSRLLPKHRDILYKSGLEDVTIDAIGFISSLNGDSYLEPVKDIGNKITKGYRARYNEEAIKENKYSSKEGSTPKYRPSKELKNTFYYPHLSSLNWEKIAKDKTVPIFITEGCKKAALLAQFGYAGLGIFGVYNWLIKEILKDKDGIESEKSKPIEDFNDLVWKGRIVYIVFDSDKYKNIKVLLAEEKLSSHLKDLGADVRIINLPYDLDAKGVDDFFVKHGVNAKQMFEDLISRSTSVSLGSINRCLKEKRKEEIPHYLAEYIRCDRKLINTNLGFHIYSSGYYKKTESEDSLKFIAAELLKYAEVVPKPYFLTETVKLLSTYCFVQEQDFNPGDLHNVSNGTLKLDLEAESIDFINHSSSDHLNYIADVKYIPDLDTKPALDFMEKVIPDENQRIIALEALGFAIFPDLRKRFEFTKFTLEYGDGSNGKSIYTDFRERIIGQNICSSLSLDALTKKDNRFAASSLYKKRANFSTENESAFIRDSSVLKQITSGKAGDKMSVEFKHKQAFFASVSPILFFAINKPPVLSANRTFAIERRMQVINFSNRFSINPKNGELLADPRLDNYEYTKDIVIGILNLTLEAIKNMLQRGKIWQNGVNETLKEAVLKGSHKEQFFEEDIESSPDSELASEDLHSAYVNYCLQEGIAQEHQNKSGTIKIIWNDENTDRACKTPHVLSKWIHQRFKGQVTSVFLKNSRGSRVRGFKGLKLKNKDVENEVCSRAALNNAELSQNNQLHTCTAESEQLSIINTEALKSFAKIKMTDVLKKELEDDAAKPS
jgi:phage/plasmid-associated DNA primase